MPALPIFLDSNIFFYAAGREHRMRDGCRALLEEVATGGVSAVTSSEVLQELLHVLVRTGSRDAAVRLTRHAMEVVSDVLAVGRKEIALACELLELHPSLNARDAVHLATLQLNGLVSIASADRHFDQIEGIRRIDPGAPRPPE